jgi:hypothetical protein
MFGRLGSPARPGAAETAPQQSLAVAGACAKRHGSSTREGGCVARGEAQLSSVLAYSTDALGNPYVAILLGLMLAAGLHVVSQMSAKLVTPESSSAGLALASLSLFGRLAFAVLALWAYQSFATTGLKPFAISLAGGFVVLYTFALVRYAGFRKMRRPVSARQ